MADTGAVLGDSAKTTVVIPAWDRYAGEPLRAALRSVLDQAGPKHVLVVDNDSHTELTVVDGVEVVRTGQRLTVGGARNHGLTAVETPYVVFWDADDVMLPGTLAFLEREIEADHRLVAYGAAIVEAPSGMRHRWPRRWIGTLARAPRALALLDCIWSQFPTTGATIMRTDVVRASGGYADADSGEDWCLGVSLAFRGSIGWSERPGRLYALDPESMWARHMGPRDQLQHAAAVRRRLRDDAAVPAWARAALPLIAVGQSSAIAAQAARAGLRRLRA